MVVHLDHPDEYIYSNLYLDFPHISDNFFEDMFNSLDVLHYNEVYRTCFIHWGPGRLSRTGHNFTWIRNIGNQDYIQHFPGAAPVDEALNFEKLQKYRALLEADIKRSKEKLINIEDEL